MAAVTALRAVLAAQPVCIVTDTKYVYDGGQTHMHRWFLRGRQVANLDL